MNDKDFLNWIADRFVNVIGESESTDFVIRLRGIANNGVSDDVKETLKMVLETMKLLSYKNTKCPVCGSDQHPHLCGGSQSGGYLH